MQTRIILFVAITSTVGGCASDGPTSVNLMPTAALAATHVAIPADEIPKKTMSDRVLAAIAFERVTGLKPDPARLTP